MSFIRMISTPCRCAPCLVVMAKWPSFVWKLGRHGFDTNLIVCKGTILQICVAATNMKFAQNAMQPICFEQFFSICSAWYGSGLMYICEHFIASLTQHLFCFFAICFRNDKGRNDKGSAHAIRRVSSQGGSLNRGIQSWGTRPPPLPREPPPQEEPTPSPQTKTPK